MTKTNLIKVAVAASLCLLTVFAYAVTRDELINKCMEAGAVVKSKDLKSATKMIENPNGPFVWHDNINYVFLMNLEGEMLAHPFNPELKKSGSLLKYADSKGSLFFCRVCESGGIPGGHGVGPIYVASSRDKGTYSEIHLHQQSARHRLFRRFGVLCH